MNKWEWEKKEAAEFAQYIKDLGFQVHLSKSGTSGFITDEAETRVLSFTIDGFFSKLHGNYGPPSREAGTGWVLDTLPGDLHTKEDVHRALYAHPPSYCQGWKYLSTVAQYLESYQQSSCFTNHDTAMACLAMTNEVALYNLIAKLPRRPKHLTFLWSINLYAKKHGFHQSKLNRDEVLAHAQSIWDDHHSEG